MSYSDPYGLNPCLLYPKACDIVAGAAIGAVMGAATQAISNAANDRPLTEGVGKAALTGGVVGGALGGVGTLVRAARGANVLDDAARTGAGVANSARITLQPNTSVLAVVDDAGKIIAQSFDKIVGAVREVFQ